MVGWGVRRSTPELMIRMLLIGYCFGMSGGCGRRCV
jgi:hypothetical protein